MSIITMISIFIIVGIFLLNISDLIKIPKILLYIAFGIIFSYFFSSKTPSLFWQIEPSIKTIALTIIVLRAGLSINKAILKKIGITAILMGFIPCLFEATCLTFVFLKLFNFSLEISLLTASIVSAVSPAVIVPTMINLKSKGIGDKKEIPNLILASASLDDVFAISLFSIILGFINSTNSNLIESILYIPFSFVIALIIGVFVGFILNKIVRKADLKFNLFLLTILVLFISLLLNQLCEIKNIPSLLSIMTISFIIFEKSPLISLKISENLSFLWIIFEIMLFIIIGFSVDIPTAFSIGLKGFIAILIGLLARSLGVLVSTSFSILNMKEKLFCILAYLPKATVQAGLGSIALSLGLDNGKEILAISLLSIIITVPLGVISIQYGAKKLLK